MSAIGYPDYQRITQWLGSPLVQATGLVIGLGPHTDGPLEVANFAAIVVALKATGGNVTVTVKQTIQGGPAPLVLSQQVVVAAGATLFEAFVLFGTAVEIDLAGSVAGTSVDYALYGSNTTTNAQVITSATINVQHNDVLVAAEATLDFMDTASVIATVTDDAPNTRVKVALATVVGADGWATVPAALTYSSTDGHTFVVTTPVDLTGTIGVGDRIRLTDAGTKYFLVSAIAAGTITLYGGTTYALTGGAITNPSYSHVRTPLGFPTDPLIWREQLKDVAARNLVSTTGVWINDAALQLAVPIGLWDLEFSGQLFDNTAADADFLGTLSTANNTESDNERSDSGRISGVLRGIALKQHKPLNLAAKTTYFLNAMQDSGGGLTISWRGDVVPTMIRAWSRLL